MSTNANGGPVDLDAAKASIIAEAQAELLGGEPGSPDQQTDVDPDANAASIKAEALAALDQPLESGEPPMPAIDDPSPTPPPDDGNKPEEDLTVEELKSDDDDADGDGKTDSEGTEKNTKAPRGRAGRKIRGLQRLLSHTEGDLKAAQEQADSLRVNLTDSQVELTKAQKTAEHWKTKALELQKELAEMDLGPSSTDLELDERKLGDQLEQTAQQVRAQAAQKQQTSQMAAALTKATHEAVAIHGGDAFEVLQHWNAMSSMAAQAGKPIPSIATVAQRLAQLRVLEEQKSGQDNDRQNVNANRDAPTPMETGPGAGADFPATPEGMKAFLLATEGQDI